MSSIEWTGKTWNPSVGCHKVSQGCKNCYAEKMHARLTKMGQPKYAEPFRVVKPWPDHLDIPLRRKKATTWFVNSMTDLFHEDLPDEYIAAVFGVMAACPQHTFQVLTKRPERALRWWELCVAGGGASVPMRWARSAVRRGIESARVNGCDTEGKLLTWPLPNVWLGTSVEDQDTADERIPLLLQCPAAVRFVSYEPALGPVDFVPDPQENWLEGDATFIDKWHNARGHTTSLDWVIVGGESGPGARPCDVEWLRGAVEQCRQAHVPVFVKQLGAQSVCDCEACRRRGWRGPQLTDRKGGDMSEWPEDLRVRELPV